VRKFAIFLIAALLPSDAVIRFGRNLPFQAIDSPEDAAQSAPAATVAQILAFAAFVVAFLTLVSNELVSAEEFAQVNEVGRTLVVALLPSEAAIRFARALHYRSPKARHRTRSLSARLTRSQAFRGLEGGATQQSIGSG